MRERRIVGWRRGLPLAMLVVGLVAPIVAQAPLVAAVGEPVVTWATADGGTVGGLVDLSAEAVATSGTINRWCLAVNGTPVTSNVATYGGDPYRFVNSYGVFNATTGCWTSNVVDLAGASFVVDASKWANGSYTFAVQVTDSSARTTTSSISLVVANKAPTVTWDTPDGDTYAGQFTIVATAAGDPAGTAEVRKWCLTVDGAPVTSNVAVYGGPSYTYVSSYGTFNGATGCWSSNVVELSGGAFLIDSSGWANGQHTFVVTVTDSSGRSTTSSALTATTTNAGPQVGWVTTDLATQSGIATIRALAAADPNGTSVITKWCLRFEGQAVDVDIRSEFGSGAEISLWYASFDPATGCWTDADGDITGGRFDFDTSSWPDGDYSFQLTVTDSAGRSATSNLLMVRSANAAPSMTVGAPAAPPAKVSRRIQFTVAGAPAATSTAAIDTWCLAIDGVPIKRDITEQNYFSTNLIRDNGTFNAATGCYSPTYVGDDVSSGRFTLDTTTWSNRTHTITVKLTDTAGKVTTRQISLLTSNPLPTVSVSGLASGMTARRQLVVFANATFVAAQSDLKVTKWCLSLDGGTCRAGSTSGFAALWSVNTATMRNGAHTAVVWAQDSAGRVVRKATYSFSVSNVAPAVVSVAGSYRVPRIGNTSASITLSMRTASASQITIRWGTSRTSLTSSKVITAASGADAVTKAVIGGLRFGTTYYFEVRSKNSVGGSAAYVYSTRSPRSAYITSTSCTTYVNYRLFYAYYTHVYTYRWSSGEETYSDEYAGHC